MWAEIIVAGVTRYLEAGLCVALLFGFVVGRVEPSAARGSIFFRLLIVPGATLLWPWVLLRSIRALLPRGFRPRSPQTQTQTQEHRS